MNHWADIYSAYWASSLTAKALQRDDVAKFWEDEIRRCYQADPPEGPELCEVLKYLFDQDRFQRQGPNLNDVRRAVLAYRNRLNDGGALRSCEICFSGWMTYYPDGGEFIRFDAALKLRAVSLPCTCQSGRLLLDTLPIYKKMNPYQSAEMSKLRQKGAKQNASIKAGLVTMKDEMVIEYMPKFAARVADEMKVPF